ncbi:TonB-dependent receptor [Methylobacillus sp. Pita1]|uniref:TonB-dependent receptor n=1 Tax=Methylobacillus sp. Pita1 TaxID=3382642 RepID=UPI0038B68E30
MRPPVDPSRSCRLAALVSLAFPGAFLSVLAFAAEKASEEGPSIVLDAIEVQAAPEELTNSLDPSSTLSGKELMLKSAATLGATLQDELGVANATFGPNVGLPLIRGQHGPRTRVMVNGVGTHDASAMSPDHGTTVESLLAKEIKVLRGPATIRNGGGAIGGAVEITDGRIPERLPAKTKVTTQLRFNTNHDERIMATELLTKAGQVAFHADVHGRESNDIHVPGMAIDEAALAYMWMEPPGDKNTHGYTGNTNARSKGGSVGASIFGEMGYMGVSLSHYANNYGIPMGLPHSHPGAPVVDAERVRIDMEQERIDLKGELFLPYEWLESIALRIGKSRYHHDELSSGIAQTRFNNDVIEHRLEFNHRLFPNLTGTLGFHGINRDFSALGVEAFVPESKIDTKGFYLIETLDFNPWQLEFGFRKEKSKINADVQPVHIGTIPRTNPAIKKEFSPESYTLALKRTYKTGSITINRWIARRAPDIQELAAFGPHLATKTYDVGNGYLETETLNGWDIRLQQKLGKLDTNLNLFKYSAENYIYQQNYGFMILMESGFYYPKTGRAKCDGSCMFNMRYEQQDARFYGYEAEVGLPLQIPGMRKFRASVFADQVRGMLDDNTHVPRLTPARHGLLIQAGIGKWDGDIRLTHVRAQTRTGTMPTGEGDEMMPEPGTDSYNKVDIALRRSIEVSNWFTGDLFINMRNITNAEIRNSTSFLRYYTPELGRNIEIGMRIDL